MPWITITWHDRTEFGDCTGAEIDLVLRKGRQTLAFELKSSTGPRVSKGFWNALDDISPDEAYVVAPVEESYPMKNDVMVIPLQEIIAKLQEKNNSTRSRRI